MLSHESYCGLVFFLYCYRFIFAGIVSFLFPVCPVWYEGYLLSISFCSFLLAYAYRVLCYFFPVSVYFSYLYLGSLFPFRFFQVVFLFSIPIFFIILIVSGCLLVYRVL